MDDWLSLSGRSGELKARTERCVCKYCGGALELRRIVFSDYEDARIEIFCSICDRIEYGVEPEIYHCAQYFVEELDFNCYGELDDNMYTRRMTIAKVCEILTWGMKQLGFLCEEGFAVEPKLDASVVGECLLIDDEKLSELLAGRREK